MKPTNQTSSTKLRLTAKDARRVQGGVSSRTGVRAGVYQTIKLTGP